MENESATLTTKPTVESKMMLEELLNEASVLWSRISDSRGREARPIRPSETSKRFPGVQIGESLWRWDVEDGFERLVVVGKIDDYCIVVSSDYFINEPHDRVWVSCADNATFWSRGEAVRAQASDELRYHQCRVEYIRKVLAAAEIGEELSGFRGFRYDRQGGPQ